MFKKIDEIDIPKPQNLVQEEKKPKTMIELMKDNNHSVEKLAQELKMKGLTDRESNAFIDIFVNNIHYSEVAKKYSIQFTEVMTLHSKFSILARSCGVDPNKIINLLK